MKLLVKIGPDITVQAEGNTTADLIKEIALIQETFEDNVCGLCGSQSLKYVYRQADDNEFYELKCIKCGAKLTFGNPKKRPGCLYPRRYKTNEKGISLRDDQGKAIRLGRKGNGWLKWNPETQQEE